MDGQNEIYKHIRKGINTINDSLKNTRWSLEEIRSGGKQADAGTVDAKGGSLLATINRNLVSVMELIPETNTALCNERRLVVGEASTNINITKEMQDSKKRPLQPRVPTRRGNWQSSTTRQRVKSILEHWKRTPTMPFGYYPPPQVAASMAGVPPPNLGPSPWSGGEI